jgi:hypothetical protein
VERSAGGVAEAKGVGGRATVEPRGAGGGAEARGAGGRTTVEPRGAGARAERRWSSSISRRGSSWMGFDEREDPTWVTEIVMLSIGSPIGYRME